MTSDMDELWERLIRADRKELRPCTGCFMECRPGKGTRPYGCTEPLRKWAVRHRWSASYYEEDGNK